MNRYQVYGAVGLNGVYDWRDGYGHLWFSVRPGPGNFSPPEEMLDGRWVELEIVHGRHGRTSQWLRCEALLAGIFFAGGEVSYDLHVRGEPLHGVVEDGLDLPWDEAMEVAE